MSLMSARPQTLKALLRALRRRLDMPKDRVERLSLVSDDLLEFWEAARAACTTARKEFIVCYENAYDLGLPSWFVQEGERDAGGSTMLSMTDLVTYVLIVSAFVFVPGPATLLTVARATSSGTKAGVATAAGIAIGDVIHTLLAIAGLSAVIAASAWLFDLIKYAGAAYLIYLGVSTLKRGSTVEPHNPVVSSAIIAMRQAIVTELLNPKTALFFLAFLPQFVRQDAGPVLLQLTVLGLLFVLIGFLSTLVFALGAGRFHSTLLVSERARRWQARVAGSLYCALGVRVALQQR